MNQATWRRLWRRLGFFVSENEKVLLAFLSVMIVISGAFWFRQYAESQDQGPNIGGTYVEGLVGDQESVDSLVAEITRVGLFRFGESGELLPVAVESWTKNEAATEYSFLIKNTISAQSVADQLLESIDILGSVEITAKDQHVEIISPIPNPNLPILLTQPLLDGGPYKLSKKTETTTILTKNPNTISESPYINKIVIHRFNTDQELEQALGKKRLDGALTKPFGKEYSHYLTQSFSPPRYFGVVVNVNKAPFRDESFRKAVIESAGQLPAKAVVLTVPDQEPARRLAEALVVSWQSRGLTVTVKAETLEEFTNTTLPTRSFEAAVMGIDYGAELDPYYIWSSDQVRPPSNNVSGIKDSEVDRIIDSIRSTLNVSVRNQLINDLHSRLSSLGVALILEQQKFNTLVSDRVVDKEVRLPLALHDKFKSISRWYLK